MMDRQASSSCRSQFSFSWPDAFSFPPLPFLLGCGLFLRPVALVVLLLFLDSPRPRRFFFSRLSSRVLSKAASSRQNPPLPGSSLERGILMKHLFNDKLCRIEFCHEGS